MDILFADVVDPAVARWLAARHDVVVAPELARDRRALAAVIPPVRALVVAPGIVLDRHLLARATRLEVVASLWAEGGAIDVAACTAAGVRVCRPRGADAAARAEFALGAVLQMLRRVPVGMATVDAQGRGHTVPVGRELSNATCGLIGWGPVSRVLASMLRAFGTTVLCYDPRLHVSDPRWAGIEARPVSLSELYAASDAVCAHLPSASRYRGVFSARVLREARQDQVIYSSGPAWQFDETALADALTHGPVAALWLDNASAHGASPVDGGWSPHASRPGREGTWGEGGSAQGHASGAANDASSALLRSLPNVQVTAQLGPATRDAQLRAAWMIAQRIDEVLQGQDSQRDAIDTLGLDSAPQKLDGPTGRTTASAAVSPREARSRS